MTRRHTAFISILLGGLLLALAAGISTPSGPVQAQSNPWSAIYYSGNILTGGATQIPNGTVANIPHPLNRNYPGQPLDATGTVPIAGSPSDNWSAEYRSFQTFAAGEWSFSLTADDRAQLFVTPSGGTPGVPLLSVDNPGETRTVNVVIQGGGAFDLLVRLSEISGVAFVQVNWTFVGGGGGLVTPGGPTPTPAATATATVTPLPPIPPGALTATVIQASVLNIRDAPSLGGNRIGQILRGQTYAVVGRDADARWFILQLGGYQGWAYGFYLFFNFNEFTAPISSGNALLGLAGFPDTGVRIQSRATVRLRAAPTVASEQTGRITWGAFLPVVGRTADNFWYQVVWRQTVGWAYAPFFEIIAGDLGNVPVR